MMFFILRQESKLILHHSPLSQVALLCPSFSRFLYLSIITPRTNERKHLLLTEIAGLDRSDADGGWIRSLKEEQRLLVLTRAA
jgi:hypothetical protein